MFVSDMRGVRPYLRTPDGFTGARGRFEATGRGIGVGIGCAAGAPGSDGVIENVLVGFGAGVLFG